jgi:hypothetical protein
MPLILAVRSGGKWKKFAWRLSHRETATGFQAVLCSYESISASPGRIAPCAVIAMWKTDPYSMELK